MRRRLLDATVTALHKKGYAGTTTLEVQKRAGVSRGALLYHFASRAELMLAAVDHLSRQRIDEVVRLARAEAPKQGRTERIEWALRVLWSTFEGPLFTAALELWLAARNDPDLLAALLPQERVIGQAIRGLAAEAFGPEVSTSPGFGDVIELLADAMRGAAARTVLRSAAADERLVKLWVEFVNGRLGSAPAQARNSL